MVDCVACLLRCSAGLTNHLVGCPCVPPVKALAMEVETRGETYLLFPATYSQEQAPPIASAPAHFPQHADSAGGHNPVYQHAHPHTRTVPAHPAYPSATTAPPHLSRPASLPTLPVASVVATALPYPSPSPGLTPTHSLPSMTHAHAQAYPPSPSSGGSSAAEHGRVPGRARPPSTRAQGRARPPSTRRLNRSRSSRSSSRRLAPQRSARLEQSASHIAAMLVR